MPSRCLASGLWHLKEIDRLTPSGTHPSDDLRDKLRILYDREQEAIRLHQSTLEATARREQEQLLQSVRDFVAQFVTNVGRTPLQEEIENELGRGSRRCVEHMRTTKNLVTGYSSGHYSSAFAFFLFSARAISVARSELSSTRGDPEDQMRWVGLT